jgi:predicted MFS family arabinose efflux permease
VLGWRAPYWTALGLGLAVLAALLLLAPRAAQPARPPRAGAALVSDRALWPLAILYSASYGLGLVLANWVVELLQRHSTMSDGAAAAVGALTLVLVVASRPLGGWILNAYPGHTPQALVASIVGGTAGTIALIAAEPTWLAVLGALLVGIGAGIPFSPAFTGAAAARPDAPAAAVGLVNTAANLVVLVGTPLVGLTFSLSGEGRLGFAALALLWLASLGVVSPPRIAASP